MPSSTFNLFLIAYFSLCQFQIFHFSLCCCIQSCIQTNYNKMIKITFNRSHPLSFRPIAHISEQEATDTLQRLNRSSQPRKSLSRQEHLVVRNGVLVKLQNNQLPFGTLQTKIAFENKVPAYQEQFHNQIQVGNENIRKFVGGNNLQQKTGSSQQAIKTDSNNQEYLFQMFNAGSKYDLQQLKEQYLRVWFQKMALQSAYISISSNTATRKQQLQIQRYDNEQKPHNFHNYSQTITNNSKGHSLNTTHITVQSSPQHWSNYPGRNIGQIKNH